MKIGDSKRVEDSKGVEIEIENPSIIYFLDL
jgi:hypothetical protein